MAKPKTRPEGTPTAQAKGGQGPSAYAEHYKKYLPIAMQIPAEQVQPCRAAVRIVLVNVKRGVEVVCGTPEQQKLVREDLPKVPLERVLALPDVARALLFASWRAMPQASDKQISKTIQEISGPREQLLTLAELLAKRGLFDPKRVAAVRAGSGKYDMAEDAVTLATMFLEDAKKLKGMHPFTEEELTALCQKGEWLLENLTPAGARTEPKKREPSPSEDDKNRLWTLIVQDHPWVLKIGYYRYGDDFESYTPRLQARVASVANAEEPEVEEEEEEAEEEEGSGGEEPSGAPEGGAAPA